MQTYSSGNEILEVLGSTSNELIPTSYRIPGMTDDQQRIKCIFFMCIRFGFKETRHVVFVSENTSGFYLSESARKDLGQIPRSFLSQTLKTDMLTTDDGKAPREFPRRMTARLNQPGSRSHLQKTIIPNDCYENTASLTHLMPVPINQVVTGRPLDIMFTWQAQPSALHISILVPDHWK